MNPTRIIVDIQPAFEASLGHAKFDMEAFAASLRDWDGRVIVVYSDRAEPPFRSGDTLEAVQDFYRDLGVGADRLEFWPKSYGYVTPWFRHMDHADVEAFITECMLPAGVDDASKLPPGTVEAFLDDYGVEAQGGDLGHLWRNLPLIPRSLVDRIAALTGVVEMHGGSTHRCLPEVEFFINCFSDAHPHRGRHTWNDEGYFRTDTPAQESADPAYSIGIKP